MAKRMLLGILTGLLLATTQIVSGQNSSTPRVDVPRVQLIRSVSIQIRLFSAEKELVVPYCGEGEAGTESLCNLSIHIEVETRGGWRPMQLRHSDAVMGGIPPDKWKFQIIPAKSWHDFFFAFSKDEFAVERGQRLRVVVTAWADEQSMRTGDHPIHLTSPPFECP